MSRKKTKSLGKKIAFTNAILTIFGENPFKSMNYKQISKILGITDTAGKDVVHNILLELFSEGKLIEERPFRYLLSKAYFEQFIPKKQYITGIVDMKSTGKAYVTPDEGGEDIFIDVANTGEALHADKVKVMLFPKRKNRKIEGEIVDVIERKKTDYVGVLHIERNFAFLVPDSNNMPVDIFIPQSDYKGARKGDKVIARITDWPQSARNPFGEIVQVLGKPGENEVEMQSILSEYEFPLHFPKEVEQEANAIPEQIDPTEYSKRRDFREIFTITIDPIDAKDFDDALSLRKLENGNWEIGVHIADVSHYVKPGKPIDDEAFDRGTSVYLVDRVIPMLPEILSNKVCSLRPNEEKLCFSIVFELDENATIQNEWIGKTVILSNRRFTYEEVQEMLEGSEGDYKEEILILNTLATKLREERVRKGSINFHSEEIRFVLDENGKPIDTYVREQNESHQLIEDFMLLANRRVAERFGKTKGKQKTFVFRVHDEPNPEKLSKFVQLVSRLGYAMNISSRQKLVKSYNNLFKSVEGKGEKNLIETVAIRTMAKAEYSTQNIGHYGLAFPYYTHFTSPIRRYPDLIVHRLIERYLIENKPSVDEVAFEEICRHSSEMERRAAEMERESIKFKQAEYLQDKIGKTFSGLISGVSKWGLFVELKDSKSEGLVRYNEMKGDFYYLDEDNFQIIGQQFGRIYQLGDDVQVLVSAVDLIHKKLTFKLIEKE
ncbi:MAG: ribonuclease R [Lentimicrobiaceae bacterium]|nr:ribonuclease R [Lentimicrobiaceae bacterium]